MMARVFTLVALLCASLAVACSSDDGNSNSDTGAGKTDATSVDKGIVADLGVADDAAGSCGEGVYPCGPYGTQKGEVVENTGFVGFTDADAFCKPFKDHKLDFTKKSMSFASWFLPPQACPTKKKKLLWVMVSAGWCGPCVTEIRKTMEQVKAGALDDRVALTDILFENDEGKPVTEAYAKTIWAQRVGISFPLWLDPSFKMGKYFEKEAVPFNMLIDTETMQIVFRQTGEDLPAVGQAIQAFLQDK